MRVGWAAKRQPRTTRQAAKASSLSCSRILKRKEKKKIQITGSTVRNNKKEKAHFQRWRCATYTSRCSSAIEDGTKSLVLEGLASEDSKGSGQGNKGAQAETAWRGAVGKVGRECYCAHGFASCRAMLALRQTGPLNQQQVIRQQHQKCFATQAPKHAL